MIHATVVHAAVIHFELYAELYIKIIEEAETTSSQPLMENIPPPSASTDATRGLPYYEKLKRDLRETIQKKRLLDKNMANLEYQIFRFEASYLEETGAGNIIKGFDNYIKGSTTAGSTAATAGGGTSTRKKGEITESDRVFSRSSASFMMELSPTSSSQTTPSHAPTPTPGNANGALSARESNDATPTGLKKKKKSEKNEEENDGKNPKRLKITYARTGQGD